MHMVYMTTWAHETIMSTYDIHDAHCLSGSISNVFQIDFSCHGNHFICNSMIPTVQNHFEKTQGQHMKTFVNPV